MMGMWQQMRYRMGMGSRRRNKRPTTLPIQVAIDPDPEIGEDFVGGKLKLNENQWKLEGVPFDEHPTILTLYRLDMPGWLRGLEPQDNDNNFIRGIWSNHITPAQFKQPSITRTTAHLIPHLKLMAKIAHGFAVYRYGIDGFEPFLTDFIRGKDFPHPSFFIDGDWGPIPPATPHPWHIRSSIAPYGNLILVRLRIFAMLGAPVYLVIVGKHKPDSARLKPYDRLDRK